MQTGTITLDGLNIGTIHVMVNTRPDASDVPIGGGFALGRADRGIHLASLPGDAGTHVRHHGPGHVPPMGNRAAPSTAGHPTGRSPSGASSDTDAAIREAAKASGVDPNTMRSIASIESSMNPGSNRNRHTQYKGLYQIGREEWRQYGSGDIYNPHDNAMAAARMFSHHKAQFQSRFGRDPSDTELYMIHQQGMGFYTRGAMTNIHGNPYPGMHGPQSHTSFEQGWGREVERRKSHFAGARPAEPTAATPPAEPSVQASQE